MLLSPEPQAKNSF